MWWSLLYNRSTLSSRSTRATSLWTIDCKCIFFVYLDHTFAHTLLSFEYVCTFSTFPAYCQVTNFLPNKKNLPILPIVFFLHIRSSPIDRKIRVAPLYWTAPSQMSTAQKQPYTAKQFIKKLVFGKVTITTFIKFLVVQSFITYDMHYVWIGRNHWILR